LVEVAAERKVLKMEEAEGVLTVLTRAEAVEEQMVLRFVAGVVEQVERNLGLEERVRVKEPVAEEQVQRVFEKLEGELEASCQLAAEVSV